MKSFFLITFFLKVGIALGQDDGRLVRIPVIVHVIYADSTRDNGVTFDSRLKGNRSQYVSNEKIRAEVNQLDLDFQKLNSDTVAVISEYGKIIGNPKVSFYLKEIKRVKAKAAELEILTDGSNTNVLRRLSPIINSEENLNVYIGKIILNNGPTAGMAPVPTYLGANKGFDVVNLNYKWIGQGYHLLTHEAGHWLGLYHTFDKINTLTKQGINDIPEQSNFTHKPCELCPPNVTDQIKKPSRFKVSNYNNFMDYSGCRVMFSKKQAEKIRSTIINYRPKLYNNSHH